ncbi:MAG TPA: secondary thiamine-phosphate synthase enzyme YjbQ [Candidatus Krumholzibacteria bacterium]|nr:secondary thiamine-phosphate synthase enzyme YjbQ [Candidatus Krumholzibacteria bacterium]
MIEITLQTSARTEFVDVTARVADAAARLGVADGAVVVFNPHTTAGVTINEGADPDVVRDLDVILDRLVPWTGGYRHAEGNAAAHAKALLCGSSATLLVSGGTPVLGTWQAVWFCEFDGPRRRRLLVGKAGG